jgi:tryptophan 2,3-dioxygenase
MAKKAEALAFHDRQTSAIYTTCITSSTKRNKRKDDLDMTDKHPDELAASNEITVQVTAAKAPAERGTHHSIHEDFSKEMSYGDYLHLDTLLSAQQPLSTEHDEMLFIVIHQTSEVWMKLILHEVAAAKAHIAAGNLEPAFKMLSRVVRVQEQLIQSWDVLSTLTPADYMKFRHLLGHSSGFQSYQNRLIEFHMGRKQPHVLKVYEHQGALHALLSEALAAPSLYDVAVRQLAARGLRIDEDYLHRDLTQKYVPNASVKEAWLQVYRDVETYWDLYELAEKLADLDSKQQQWRFNHMNTVERVIGFKQGTGGSAGVAYLKHVVAERYYPELWQLRTEL